MVREKRRHKRMRRKKVRQVRTGTRPIKSQSAESGQVPVNYPGELGLSPEEEAAPFSTGPGAAPAYHYEMSTGTGAHQAAAEMESEPNEVSPV